MKPLLILSLGGGYQSSCLAYMYELGMLGEKPDAAIFADTMLEPHKVYENIEFIIKTVSYPVYVVSAGNLWDSATTVRTRADGKKKYIRTAVPVYLKDGLRRGRGMRACTRDFKITPVRQKCRELLGRRAIPADSGVLVRMVLGISIDEYLRAKTSVVHWIENEYPLIERKMTRQDCYELVVSRGFPPPPRSACVECPLRDNRSWRELTPQEFGRACHSEERLQIAYAATNHLQGVPYLHASRVPLAMAPIGEDGEALKFVNECEGFCGI